MGFGHLFSSLDIYGFEITMINITFPIFNETIAYTVTKQCFNWCKEQNIIHEQNLFIGDLFLLFIAMLSLLIHIIINSYYEEIILTGKIKRDYLELIKVMTLHFAFYLVAIFIIYILRFK